MTLPTPGPADLSAAVTTVAAMWCATEQAARTLRRALGTVTSGVVDARTDCRVHVVLTADQAAALARGLDELESRATAEPATTVVPTETLRALFDCAVNSMDFGSGFWDHEDTTAARAIAVLLGVDPWNATPRDHGVNYPHAFDTPDPDADWAYCRRCRQDRDHRCHHQSADQTATDQAAQP